VVLTSDGGESWSYVCRRQGDWFREMNLEVDVCQSVSNGSVLPRYDTHGHDDRPAELPRRLLTIEECYREAGVKMTVA
jgi:hypothetical protein